MPTLSVVIPVYRSERSLDELYRRLVPPLEVISKDFEIIFVDDCGGDNSWAVICNLAAEDRRVKGVQLSRNFGQHAATICGISRSQGTWIITLDDDLEHQPEYIPALYNKALEGYSLVYGVYSERTHSAWRNITSEIARKLFNLAIPSLNYEYTSFRVIHHTVAHALGGFDSPFPFVDGYLSWLTNSYSTVKVKHSPRSHGKSNYDFRKLLRHTINIFVTFSDVPLRVSSWIGLMSFVIGMVWFAFIVFYRLIGGITVSGFASLMAGIVLFGGIQLLVLGTIGTYLGRMNFKSSQKPLYLVSREATATTTATATESERVGSKGDAMLNSLKSSRLL
jgi:polyisoprenyl-phosphate glycosyltransferase